MPPDNVDEVAILPGPSTRGTEGRRHLRALSEAKGEAWLPWRSNGCEHGLRPHSVQPDGSVKEFEDTEPAPRRKPKAVSSRQWGRI